MSEMDKVTPEWIQGSVDNHVMSAIHEAISINWRMLYGDQMITIENGRIVNMRTKRAVKAIRNIFPRILRLYASKLTANMPLPFINPYPEDYGYQTSRVARIANGVMAKLSEDTDLEIKIGQIVMDQFMGHLGVMYVFFDPDAGNTEVDGHSMSALLGEAQIDDIKNGEVKIAVIPPQNYYWDPAARRDEDRNWAILRIQTARATAAREFPEHADVIRSEAGASPPAWSGASVVNHLTPNYDRGGATQNEGDELVDLYEVFVRKGGLPGHPKGFHCIASKSKILFQEEWDSDIPVYTYAPDRPSDQYLPPCPAENVRRHQVRINKAESMTDENMELSGVSQWIVPDGTVFKPHDSPDRVLRYRGKMKPDYKQASPYPQYIVGRGTAIYNEMLEELALTSVGAGQISGIKSGSPTSMVRFIKDMEELVFTSPARALESFYRRVVIKAFKLIQEHYKADRDIFVTDRLDSTTINKITFKGADFGDHMQVEVSAGIDIGGSSVERFENVKLFMLQGHITFDDFLEASRHNYSLDFLRQRRLKDRDRAYRNRDKVLAVGLQLAGVDLDERDYFLTESPVETGVVTDESYPQFVLSLLSEYDHHPTHLDVFTELLTSDLGDELPEIARAAVIGYMNAAKEYIRAQQEENTRLSQGAGIVPGQPPPGGGPNAASGSPEQFQQAVEQGGANGSQ